ncbi:MAG: hypothetical protein AB1427_13805 [Thermodesulfobacteriota bacterium]
MDFIIKVDPITIVMARPELENKPSWTRLEYQQCQCCPLSKEEQPYCPIAINIAHIIETFKDKPSYQKCVARCIISERIYQKKASTMEALSSALGLIMAVSGCPVMSLFKPMARFHLPFSTIEETIVRATSFYLLREYFAFKNHKVPDLELKKLHEHYETVKILNAGLLSRISGVHSNDSDKNAILIFHSLSELLSMEITTSLQSLERLFYPH